MEVNLPTTYWLSAFLLLIAASICIVNIGRSWAAGYAAVVGTAFAWYFIEPLYFPEEFIWFSADVLDLGYLSVSIFLGTFMFVTPWMVRALVPKQSVQLRASPTDWSRGITIEKLVILVTALWLVLLSYGVLISGGDLVGALFPMGGRSESTVSIFGRAGGADAGPTGFIVSAADYLYRLCLGTFGLLLPLTRKNAVRLVLVCLIVISWPAVFLLGTRNVALAVIAPFFASFMLFGRVSVAAKVLVLVVGFLGVDFAMRAMVNLRNVGFRNLDISSLSEGRHLGLNMASELMHVTMFIQNGTLSSWYGGRYLVQAANIIPRAIWPDKPLIGIDYAIARGFGGADGDLGIFASIATGLIGQGVLDFGNFAGPVFVGVLMAAWVGILNRMRISGGLPRIGLFLIGLGLTFNLGREITLLVLFPFIFGLVLVWLLENMERRRKRRCSQTLMSAQADQLRQAATASSPRTRHSRHS
jgi:hypothetical protein